MEAFAQGQAVQSRQAPEGHNYFDVKKQQIGLEKRCVYIYIYSIYIYILEGPHRLVNG